VVAENPWIVFPGNTQGRHVRETGPKGCVVVTVLEHDEISVEPVDLDVVRWHLCTVDVAGTNTEEDVFEAVEQGLSGVLAVSDQRPSAVRLELIGACRAHERLCATPERWHDQFRAIARSVGGEDLWLEKVRISTSRHHDMEKALLRDDALGGLLRSIQSLDPEAVNLTSLAETFKDLRKKLPLELLDGEDSVDPTDTAYLNEPLQDAKELLLARLQKAGDSEADQ
jgi:hypothetical protein